MADDMAQASREMYPQLDADIERAQQNPGVVAFLFDTMIDMEPLGYCDVNGNPGQQQLVEDEQIPRGEYDEESVELVSQKSQNGH